MEECVSRDFAITEMGGLILDIIYNYLFENIYNYLFENCAIYD